VSTDRTPHVLLPTAELVVSESAAARLQVATRVAAALTALIGLTALAGWATGYLLLDRFVTGWPVMAPNSAAAFVLAGTALWLLAGDGVGERWRIGGRLSVVVVGAVGASAIVEYLTGVDLGIDRLLFSDRIASLTAAHPGRPSVYAAIALLISAIALLSINAGRERRWATGTSSLSGAVTLSAAVAYLYGSTSLRGPTVTDGIALPTVVALVVLNAGILCARPDRTPVRLFAAAGASGVLARRLLPAILVVPVLLGMAGEARMGYGLVDPAIRRAAGVLVTVAVLLAVVNLSLRTVRRAEVLAEATAIELRRTEQEARWHAELLSAVLSSISDGVIVVDEQGSLLLENPAASALLGKSAAGAPVDAWPDYFGLFRSGTAVALPADDLPLARAMRGEDGGDIEISVRNRERSDGAIVAMSADPLAASGRQRGAVAVLHDITEQRHVTADLQASEERLRLLLDGAPDFALYALDAAGLLATISATTCRLTGYTEGELLGRPFADLFTDDARAEGVPEALLFEAEKRGRSDFEGQRLRKDGSTYWAASTIIAHFGDGSAHAGFVVVSQDITDRKRIEREVAELNRTLLTLNEELEQRVSQRTAELQEQAETLTRVNDELEAFSYSVSHDLRAPLRTVGGFASLIAEQYGDRLDDEGNRYLDKIRDGGQRMGQLIDGLLAFSRLQRQDLAVVRVAMETLVHDVWDQLAPNRAERTIRFTMSWLPDCMGDSRLLWHVLTNLLDNAIKYTRNRDDADVEVGCRKDDDGRNVYYVRDNGTGFDMRYVGKLFKVFQRLHRAEDFEGTGIGLALAARVVHRHGGDIWAEGDPGLGATFYFTVPPKGRV
jgi:PAS domain S-box-containing protein